ncbi:unnamed protein product [Pylaiella littoralis]
MIRGLVGLSVICSAAGFAGGPISGRARSTGSSNSSRVSASLCGTSYDRSVGQQPTMKAWRSIKQHRRGVTPCMMTATDEGGVGDQTAEAAAPAAAPRLKRVRRRRKDGASVAVAEEEEEEEAGASAASAVIGERPPPPISPPTAVAAAAAPQVVTPQTVSAAAAQQTQGREVEGDEEETPMSVGGTKGKKIRVVDTADDDMAERFAVVASAASGVAGGAASAVSGAAKSAMGAAMSALGQGGGGGGGAPAADGFDIDSMPARRERGRNKRTTPGKTASELADLGADIERFRRAENRQPETAGESIASGAKDIISTIISIDFFVVIAFMLWFIAGVVSSYGFDNTFLLDEFNDKWTPVVQPALGVLMGGTIAGGVVSKLGESGDDGDDSLQGGGPRGI